MADAGVPVEEHRARILAPLAPLPPVEVLTRDALGLVCATDVAAAHAVPRFDHAAMDGYAVRAAEVAAATPARPSGLPVAGVAAAGDAAVPDLAPGSALRIMTGAPIPAGADAVVPFEWTDRGAVRVLVHRSVATGRHVRRAGEDVAAEAVVARAGAVLAPRHLGLLAAAGLPSVRVHPAPRVAVVATGAELVGVGPARTADGPGQVADSNTVALVSAARAAGADPASHGPLDDDVDALPGLLAAAAAGADLVVTTGGISAGDHDVVKAALAGRDGAWFGSVAVKPGRPQGVARILADDGRRVPLVALPGSPVAAYVTFLLFVVPALRRLAGRPPAPRRTAPLAAEVPTSGRTVVLPGRYDDAGRVAVLPGHAGHSLHTLAAADALIVLPPRGRLLPAGTDVAVLPLEPEDR